VGSDRRGRAFSVLLCTIGLIAACSRRPSEANAGTVAPAKNAMTIDEDRSTNEAAIRDLVDRLVKAVRAKDLDGVMSAYAPGLVAFDIVPPLQYVGAESYEKPWREVFELYESPLQYEVRDLRIIAGDDVAFSHSLNRLTGTMKNGRKTDLWLRWSAGYRKIDGKWLIAHLQASVPVDMATGKARLDLKP
jgi:uncharacterized protein (TIGR02246 family)